MEQMRFVAKLSSSHVSCVAYSVQAYSRNSSIVARSAGSMDMAMDELCEMVRESHSLLSTLRTFSCHATGTVQMKC